jgi:hypothetical protein
MGKKIRIIVGAEEIEGELNETHTAQKIWESLPIEGVVNRWGEEIYFEIPVNMGKENPKEVVSLGDIGYWPPGKAFCIFFGKTPISRGDEIRPASEVNLVGKIYGDFNRLKSIGDGETIVIKKEEGS